MDMTGMDMEGATQPRAWGAGRWSLMLAMWWTMMVAMMAPSAAPTILLYARVWRHNTGEGAPPDGLAPTSAFLAGYLVAWFGFSLVAVLLQWQLEKTGLLSASMMGSQSRWLSAALLAGAGLYQLSPLKTLCLSHCRSPAAFLARHWRPGYPGALRLGMLHGAYCVGCCWLLMGLLFVGGVMNLVYIAALAILVLAEKLFPKGAWIGRTGGVVLLAWAVATLVV